jgi:hypothetical protein
MRRREFITQIGGGILGAAVRSVALRAEPAAGKPAKIGFLYPGPEAVAQSRSALLLEGMRSEGIDPQTVTLMVRGTDGDTARIGPLFDELIARQARSPHSGRSASNARGACHQQDHSDGDLRHGNGSDRSRLAAKLRASGWRPDRRVPGFSGFFHQVA